MNGKYENLWTFPPIVPPKHSTENVPEIMQAQVEYLNEGMGGLVKAAFHMMKADIKDKNIKQKDDANSLLYDSMYVFDIYNSLYNFRVCYIYLSPFYPIKISLDDDLTESIRNSWTDFTVEEHPCDEFDTEYTEYVLVRSDEALMKFLKMVFSTKKIQFILYKLRQQSEEKETLKPA